MGGRVILLALFFIALKKENFWKVESIGFG